ncbi:MAG: hypothetical protein JKY90_08210 [Gammaproteobacteria bacterium]|nr:hypothetical protein [Gammaproteobacteria bacterium]
MAALAWWVYSAREINIKFLIYLSVTVILLLILSSYTQGGIPVSGLVATVIKFMFVYFVIATVREKFLGVYTRLVIFLAAVSIIGYASDQFSLLSGLVGLFPAHQWVGPTGIESGYEGMLYMFRFNVHLDRNNSIFFEPGAYQFFLNAAIFILFFYDSGLKKKEKMVGLSILLVTIATTQSTTGYMTTALIMLGAFLYSQTISNGVKLAAVIMAVLMLVLLAPLIQSVIFDKIERYSSIESIGDKQDLRSFELLVDKEIIKKYPFGLGYEGYRKAFSVIGKTRLGRASSNGITKLAAIFGLPFTIFYLGSMLWAFLVYNKNIVVSFIGFVSIVLFLYSEAYYLFSPIMLAIIVGMFVVRKKENTLSTKERKAKSVADYR